MNPEPGSGAAADGSGIALVISSLRMGGAEKVMAFLVNGLAAEGQRVRILLTQPPGGEPPYYPLDPRVRVESLGFAGRFRGPFGALRRVAALRRALLAERPGAVISFIHRTNVQVLFALLGSGVPVLVSEHINPRYGPAEKRWRILRRMIYPRARTVTVLTERCAAYFRPWLGARVRVLPNPVPEPEPREAAPHARRHEILGCGRLVPQKGFDLLIRAFHSVAPRLAGWNVSLYGDGPLRGSLQALIAELGLKDRIFLRGVTRTPHDAMRDAAIFALPSRYEGFPIVLCEAMACGMAVVAMDCETGPRELITSGEDGLLVPSGDVNALAEALLMLAHDPGRRAALGARAAGISRKYAPGVILEQWRSLLRDAQGRDAEHAPRRGAGRDS
jgi:GalNAc-alpha-(1->4)-GalNAc-alpha-(1->3)-diNAcBac-PP-undecaprenol alpha-1,4-N-acetyl-D-galactosaminyltransferase